MKLYTSDGTSYEGMDESTVTVLRTELGKSTTFVSEAEYLAYLLAHQPVPLTPAEIVALFRAQAIDLVNVDPTPPSKFVRAVLLTILDEINVIRALLPGPPAPRTVTQMKNAIAAKINAGVAD